MSDEFDYFWVGTKSYSSHIMNMVSQVVFMVSSSLFFSIDHLIVMFIKGDAFRPADNQKPSFKSWR